ncbi:MAG: 50S ribosomal protein L32 [Bdellovibrionales bacterium]|nr:50S ribosomal protein L32 [Bdellovibrionales bacterium]
MASPKSKISRSKRGMRRAHTALKRTTTIQCDNCGAVAQPHKVCVSCGYYKGKEVLVARD